MALDYLGRQALADAASKRLDLAQRESDRLGQLLEDVLAYAVRRTASPEPFALDALIRALLPSLQALPSVYDAARCGPTAPTGSVRSDAGIGIAFTSGRTQVPSCAAQAGGPM